MTYYPRNHVEREILSALLDGELSADQRRLVYEHLQGCEACRELSEELGAVQGMITELPRLSAPEDFVADALGPRRQPWRERAIDVALRGRRRWVIVGLGVVSIVITLLGLVITPSTVEPPVDALIARHVTVSETSSGQVLTGSADR